MTAVPTPPGLLALEADLLKPAYRAGELNGRWHLLSLSWPCATFDVAAAPRPGSPPGYAFRFDLTGYPTTAPTAQPWDAEADAPLPERRWPTGTGVFASVFRPQWMAGRCLYLPCDRLSANGHHDWRHQHPDRQWDSARGVVHYLEQVHALLTEGGYAGVARA